jgi:hypothetical protein
MERSTSWKVNRFSASQEISSIIWNTVVHYHVYKCPPPVPILSQISPVYVPLNHLLKIPLNIILPFVPGIFKCSLSLSFPLKTYEYFGARTCILDHYIFWCGKFTILTPLPLLSWCRLSFPIVSLEIFSLPTFALKSSNRIFIWYLGKWFKNLL